MTAEDIYVDFREWANIWFSIMRPFCSLRRRKVVEIPGNYDEVNRIEKNRSSARVLHVYRESCHMGHVCVCGRVLGKRWNDEKKVSAPAYRAYNMNAKRPTGNTPIAIDVRKTMEPFVLRELRAEHRKIQNK